MSLYRTLEAIAAKLDISESEMQVLYCFTKVGANRWAMVSTLRILNKLTIKHDLKDSQFEISYGRQLFNKGILNEEEAKFFDSTENTVDTGITRTEPGSDGNRKAPQGVTDISVSRKGSAKGRRKRKTKAHPVKSGARTAVSAKGR